MQTSASTPPTPPTPLPPLPTQGIHPTAIVDGRATIDPTATVGPYAIIEGDVTLGPGVTVGPHAVLTGPLTIGEATAIHPFARVGAPPQDYKFTADSITAGVTIGANTIIREYTSVHASTHEHTPTVVGDRCFLMASTHIGHDCAVGNDVILVNYAALAGHTTVADNVTISGHCGTHQFVRIGRLAFFSGGTHVGMDVPPFCVVNERQRLGGINHVGMRRNGISRHDITKVRSVFREVLWKQVPATERLEILRERGIDCPPIAEIAEFVANTKRGIVPGLGRPPRGAGNRVQAGTKSASPEPQAIVEPKPSSVAATNGTLGT